MCTTCRDTYKEFSQGPVVQTECDFHYQIVSNFENGLFKRKKNDSDIILEYVIQSGSNLKYVFKTVQRVWETLIHRLQSSWLKPKDGLLVDFRNKIK